MDQSQEILLGHAILTSRECGYHVYRHTARSISNKNFYNDKKYKPLLSRDSCSSGLNRLDCVTADLPHR